MKRLLWLALLAIAVPAAADVLPVPDRRDPRLATLRYRAANSFRLSIPVGGEMTIILPLGETLQGINVASPGDWQVIDRGNGQQIAIRPFRPVPDTTMTLTSSAREYRFVLSTTPSSTSPLIASIVGVPRAARTPKPTATQGGMVWVLAGNSELKPSSIRDDGARTYLEWPASLPIPAVFAVDRLGREEMVNGFMRGQTFVIDRVFERLVFRIDAAVAEARREPARRRS